MTDAFKAYLALSEEDRRAADISARLNCNNRTFKELFEAGFSCTVDWLLEVVELGKLMLASGMTESKVAWIVRLGR